MRGLAAAVIAAATLYDVVLALHILAVVAAYGAAATYPLLVPYVRRHHPRAMPGVHDVQHWLNRRLVPPASVLLASFGVYMAFDRDLWSEAWLVTAIVLFAVISVVGGAVIVPASRRMAELAEADVAAAPPGGAVTWSPEYDRLYGRYLAVEVLLVVLVVAAVVFMAAKPVS